MRDIWKLFETQEEKEERKESGKKKKENKRLINDKIIRDIRKHFKEEDYYKPKRVSSFWNYNHIEYESTLWCLIDVPGCLYFSCKYGYDISYNHVKQVPQAHTHKGSS